jgi:hypothetical protein
MLGTISVFSNSQMALFYQAMTYLLILAVDPSSAAETAWTRLRDSHPGLDAFICRSRNSDETETAYGVHFMLHGT